MVGKVYVFLLILTTKKKGVSTIKSSQISVYKAAEVRYEALYISNLHRSLKYNLVKVRDFPFEQLATDTRIISYFAVCPCMFSSSKRTNINTYEYNYVLGELKQF